MSGWENPAAALREELRARFPDAMVRWDASGRALVMTDAPRRGYSVTDVPVENGLAFYDLPLNKMITPPAPVFGAYADGVFALQAALATTLARIEKDYGKGAAFCAARWPRTRAAKSRFLRFCRGCAGFGRNPCAQAARRINPPAGWPRVFSPHG